jgi:myo-inositol-1(or 4)-monophosphatase
MNAANLTEYRRAAEEAARRGAEQLESWRARFVVREKGRADLVTDADLASQHAVRSFLEQQFPDHGFVGEEDPASHGRPAPGSPPTWVVDPLDGTTNYAHDVPAYCVSIGLVIDGQPAVGVIYDPRTNELFSGAAGQGATLNGTPIAVSKSAELGHSLIGVGFSSSLRTLDREMACWKHLARQTRSLRRNGSTAISLAYVAAGRFDGYWSFTNNAWDVVAGFLLVREAGGTVTCADGSPLDPFRPDSAVSNGLIQEQLLAQIRSAPTE